MNGFRGIHPIIDHEVIFPVNHIDIEYYILEYNILLALVWTL